MNAPVELLFKTKALRISEADCPFWYTSGELGPYYINTHYLCGGEQQALNLLDLITTEAASPATLPEKVLSRLELIYQQSPEYRAVIDSLCEICERDFPLDDISGISGGQRRDWFFAPIVAKRLAKPCLYLYNDGTAYDEYGELVQKIEDGVFLNICDLLRVGSSYTSKWIPCIEALGGKLLYSLSVVDRREGGEENLLAAGVVKSSSLFQFDEPLFRQSVREGLLNENQFAIVAKYLQDPRGSMRDFLQAHPEFLKEALASEDEKTRGRAQTLLEKDYYQLSDGDA